MSSASPKHGLVFGVFDNFHEGHRYFLREAVRRCEKLTVVVTPSEIVELLKGRPPKNSFELRAADVRAFDSSYNVVSGDSELGTWNILKETKPDIIFLGYDQQGIAKELEQMNVSFTHIDSHFPEKYKSSLVLI